MSDSLNRLSARLAAVNFVLANGEEIGDDPAGLTALFTEMLLQFETHAGPLWPQLPPDLQFHLAMETVRNVLSELLPNLDRRLFAHDRFEWRMKLCRLVLRFMADPGHASDQPALASALDYYFLVRKALQTTIEHRDQLLLPGDYDDYAYSPN